MTDKQYHPFADPDLLELAANYKIALKEANIAGNKLQTCKVDSSLFESVLKEAQDKQEALHTVEIRLSAAFVDVLDRYGHK